MTEEKAVEYTDEQLAALNDLYFRRGLAFAFKDIIDKAEDDPRRPEALAEMNRQIAELDGKITEITGKPPDVTVGLNTAVIFGQVPKLGA